MILHNLVALAAVDQNWGIGKDNRLLVSLPEDQRDVFRKYTLGHTVIYGRKTLETFFSQKPLSGRDNLVLSRNTDYCVLGATMVRSTKELISYLQSKPARDFYLIGGEQVYRSFLPYCSRAIITHIDHRFEADAYFPNLEKEMNWEMTERHVPVLSEKGFWFHVAIYDQRTTE